MRITAKNAEPDGHKNSRHQLRLSVPQLGRLLLLGERAKKAQAAKRPKPLALVCDQAARDMRARFAGHERPTPERNLRRFLESLDPEIRRDVIALFYFGRGDADDFKWLRTGTGLSPDHAPWHLADKLNFFDCIFEGLKRLGEQSSRLPGNSLTPYEVDSL